MPINEVEQKLAKYRAQKEREARLNYYKVEAKRMLSRFISKNDPKNEDNQDTASNDNEPLIKEESQNTVNVIPNTETYSEVDSENDQFSDISEEPCTFTLYDYFYYILWFFLWVTVFAIFIKLQFGTIYFIISGIVGMYLNTRTGPKKKNEISAYSVFNKNCESIDGTLKGEQLTREMLYGPFSR